MTADVNATDIDRMEQTVRRAQRGEDGWCSGCGHADICHENGACDYWEGCDCPAMLTSDAVLAALSGLAALAREAAESDAAVLDVGDELRKSNEIRHALAVRVEELERAVTRHRLTWRNSGYSMSVADQRLWDVLSVGPDTEATG